MLKNTNITPYDNTSLTKQEQIEHMFNSISQNYDIINRVISFRIDVLWRKKVVNIVQKFYHKKILDLATGTGDLAIMLAKYLPYANIVGLDISSEMLKICRKKILNKGLQNRIKIYKGNSNNIHFNNESFDIITIAFGIRNLEFINQSLKEMFRVLKTGGKLIILEFSRPKNSIIRFLYKKYFYYIMCIGNIISNNKLAYKYLYKSIQNFGYDGYMESLLSKCGFLNLNTLPLTFGIVSIYLAEK
ncbi:MAG: bifunctional demethylmenaquinone methyltransferase/2-methoxy-6-polyprenyl-1,4-benzoquinol methylase UbiE [Candidatus Bostrichicola ureolyticus]|nr:MAG: bifunctional demethylmenaquinone methyltransferase/2-methoxy-6-polyprenyl-1,4-benzoquinol methylase UbiE [Candidatus Bostrichicola ureolyticus]